MYNLDSLINCYRQSLTTSRAPTAKSSRSGTLSDDQNPSDILNDMLGKRRASLDNSVDKLHASVMKDCNEASDMASSSNKSDVDNERKDRR